jgi:hypothetical protein
MFLGNSGLIYKKKSDTTKARGLYKKISMPYMVNKMDKWLERLNKTED